MTTPDELDRVISHVAGELTRANAAGFGERVQSRLRARASGHLRAGASASRAAWWSLVAVTAAVAIVAAVAISSRAPQPSSSASIAAAPASVPAASVATPIAPANDVVARREAPRATIARAARRAPRAMSPAELAWLARAVPPLPSAAPVDVPEFGMTSIAPRGVDLPALVIEPLGPRDINK